MAEVERPIVKRSLLSWVFDGNLGWQITLLGVIAVAVFTRVLPLEMQKRIVNQAITLRNVDLLLLYCGYYLAAVLVASGCKYAGHSSPRSLVTMTWLKLRWSSLHSPARKVA